MADLVEMQKSLKSHAYAAGGGVVGAVAAPAALRRRKANKQLQAQIEATQMAKSDDDRTKRAVTAGLSAVGATAGAAGLGYAALKTRKPFKAARAVGATRRGALKVAAKEEPFGTALVPLEVAGLGGEIMATKILHGDTKKPKEPVVSKAEGSCDVYISPRVRDDSGSIDKGLPSALRSMDRFASGPDNYLNTRIAANTLGRGAARVGQVDRHGAKMRDVSRSFLPGAHVPKHKGPELGMVRVKGGYPGKDLTEQTNYVAPGIAGKRRGTLAKAARRFDPEADRQRRLGLYAGVGIGGGAVAGHAAHGHLKDLVERDSKTGERLVRIPAKAKVLQRGKTRTGLALAGLAALSGGGGVAAYRRGVSERNQPWN